MEFFRGINEFKPLNNRITTEISNSTNPVARRDPKPRWPRPGCWRAGA